MTQHLHNNATTGLSDYRNFLQPNPVPNSKQYQK